jgi:hypothetical protein
MKPHHTVLVFLAAVCPSPRAQVVGTKVVPLGFETTRGARQARWPFTISGAPAGRVQLCIARSALSGFADGLIRRIYFRTPDFSLDDRSVFVANVYLSSTSATPDNLSATFANNRGNDHALVHNGALIAGRQTNLLNFYPTLMVPRINPPFRLQTGANLLIEIEVTTGVNDVTIEVVDVANDAVGMVEARGTGVTMGTPSTAGYVTGVAVGDPAETTILNNAGPNCGGGSLLVRGLPIVGDPTSMVFARSGGQTGAQIGAIFLTALPATLPMRQGCDLKVDIYGAFLTSIFFTTDDQGRMDPQGFGIPFRTDILGAQIHCQALAFQGNVFPSVWTVTQPLVLTIGL